MRILFRIVQETFALVFQELRNNKLRTFLSLLGVTIGIFCIITVLSAVDSLKKNIDSGVAKLGSDMLYVQRWPWEFGNEEYKWWEYIKRPTMKYEEYKLLDERLTTAEAVAMENWFNSSELKYMENVVKNANVSAVTEHYDKIYALNFKDGRYFAPAESASGSGVVILGYEVYKKLFPPNINAVGKFIWVLEKKVKVIGVLEKEGESIIDISNDNNVLIPYNYVRRTMDMKSPFVDPVIEVKPKAGVTADEIKDDITPILRNSRKLSPRENNDFAINEVTLAADAFDEIFSVVNLVGWFIGIFSCLVGCFGIANIMFVSVKERTGIIGIKKSIGAKNSMILLEFLFEAIILSLLGCIVGLLLVWIITILASSFAGFQFILSGQNIMIGVILATSIGILAGIIPAISAARMDPVEAIRAK
ncbi:MAG: ABC transporter permease [Fimbriimonadaceae bacterium]|nr:ABC transporter permease [Chitinophagales bacterium]